MSHLGGYNKVLGLKPLIRCNSMYFLHTSFSFRKFDKIALVAAIKVLDSDRSNKSFVFLAYNHGV